MFPVTHSKFINRKAALIDGEPNIILFDETPILFTGRNKYGNHIIGTRVRESRESEDERYFHVMVTPEDFRLFSLGFKSYLELLKEADEIFVIDRDRKARDSVGTIEFQNIPQQFLPTEHSFFPKELLEPSIEYSMKIEGGSADYHLADPAHINIVQANIAQYLEKPLNALKRWLDFGTHTQLAPATARSYGINFVISLLGVPEIVVQREALLQFVNEFTAYCFDSLPKEVDALLNPELDLQSPEFDRLFEKAATLASIHAIGQDRADRLRGELKTALRKDVLAVPQILEEVAEVITTNYSSLNLNNQDLPLGRIDTEFNETLEEVIAKVEQITVDDRAKSFKIMVYSFNKHSGKGRADVFIDEQKTPIIFSVLAFEKDQSALYIDSMKEDRNIFVQGLMTYKAGSPYSLEIH